MKFTLATAAIAVVLSAGGAAYAAPTDLSGWTREGTGGTWTRSLDNNSVTQSVNGDPTVFYSDFDAIGRSLTGTVRVNTTGDDDFIGFVVGFNAGELSAPGDFLLIDWKQGTQSFHGVAPAGLAVSRVTNGLGDNAGAWSHTGLGVTELARGATLGAVGWSDLTTYTFKIDYTATNLKVSVNDVLQFDIDGVFGDGRFGFYNYSQPNVTYAGIGDTVLPPPPGGAVPEPGAWALMILGFGAAGSMLRRRRALFA